MSGSQERTTVAGENQVRVLLDLTELPKFKPIWIQGAGILGQQVHTRFKNLSAYRVAGFFDSFKTGSHDGLSVIHPKDFDGEPRQVTVVLACGERDKVVPMLSALGFCDVYDITAFEAAYREQQNIHYLPEALPGKKPQQQLAFEEGRIRAVGARLMIQHQNLQEGFSRLQELAFKSGIIHVEDDIASCALRESGDQDRLVAFYDQAVVKGILPGPEAEEQQQRAKAKGLPSVFINTILKSGTGFFTKVFKEQFGLPQFFTTLRGSPRDWPLPIYMKKFAEGGALTVQHMDAHQGNLNILAEAGVHKIFVHVRDPRQSTVSYIHHLENNIQGPLYALRNWVQPPQPWDYSQKSWAEKVEWHVGNQVAGQVQWIADWVATEEADPRFEIMFLDFDELRRDEAATINKVIAFFEIDHRVSQAEIPAKKDIPHFRAGRSQEWREVYTQRQQEELWTLIPEQLRSRFGWEK